MASSGNFQVRDKRKHPYIWYNKAIIKQFGKQLGAYGHAVYAALAMHADNEEQDCYPSYSTIAEYYGISRRQVIREIENLVNLKLIAVEVQTVPSAKGKGKETNRFYLLEIPITSDNENQISGDMTGDYQSPVTTSPTTSDYQSPVPVTTSHPNYTHENYTHVTNARENCAGIPAENIVSIKPHIPLDPDIELIRTRWESMLDLPIPTDRWISTHLALYGRQTMLIAIYKAGNAKTPPQDKRYILSIARDMTPASKEEFTDDGYPKPKAQPVGRNTGNGRGSPMVGNGTKATTGRGQTEFERLRALPVEQQPNGGKYQFNKPQQVTVSTG